MKVHELIADAVAEEGVEVVFAVMGDGNMKWLTSLEARHGVRTVYCRHEATAAGMADGYARVTGKPGVCSVTCGPGLALLGTTLIIASRNRTPLVVIAGDTPRSDPYYQQRFDQSGFVSISEAMPVDLRGPATAGADLRHCFAQARLGQPSVLSAAFDVQEAELPAEAESYRPSTELTVPRQAISPEPAVLAEAVEILRSSRRPAILGGRGAIVARKELEQLADDLGAVLATTLKAKGLFNGHPRNLGVAGGLADARNRAMLRQADCVLAVGAGLNQYTTAAGGMSPDAQIVQVSLERQELIDGRRTAVDRPGGDARASCYVQGDAGRTVAAIRASLRERAPVSDWDALLEDYDGPEMVQPPVEARPGRIHPREAMATLSEAADEDTRYAVGLGHFWWFPIAFLDGRDASSFLFIPEFGAIGQTFAAALGASVAESRPLVLIEGDGSLMMSVQELDTAVRHGIDIVVVVMNDGGLGAEFHHLEGEGIDAGASRIPAPDFARVAESFGARGARAESLEELGAALREMQAAGGPGVIDVRVDDEVINDWFWETYFAESAALAGASASEA
jgi:thiamine pyrophosphate-dependent acetolactate synthase large subunit-like protein